MQKWCPEPFTVDPGGGVFVPLAEWGESAPTDGAGGFRPEVGFADGASLLAALSRRERADIMELVEQDLRREYEQKFADAESARQEAESRRQEELEAATARWREELATGLRSEVEDALSTLAAQTVTMAHLMAEKIVRREVALDTGVLTRALETVLYKVEAGCVLQVTAHPDDAAWLREQDELRSRLRIGEVKDDRRLERGGALVKVGDHEWDVSVTRQLGVMGETLEEALSLPPETGPDLEGDHD